MNMRKIFSILNKRLNRYKLKPCKVTVQTKKNTNIRNQQNSCEVGTCKGEVYAGCPLCFRYLCHDHLVNSYCRLDHELVKENTIQNNVTKENQEGVGSVPKTASANLIPEEYEVEGSNKEAGTLDTKTLRKRKPNIRTIAKEKRNRGEEYVSYNTKKLVPARKQLKERCNGEVCKKFAHECCEITDSERQKILEAFYATYRACNYKGNMYQGM